MAAEFMTIEEITSREMFPGAVARFAHTASMTVAQWDFVAGSDLPEHSHPHEQITYVLSGEIELTVAGQARRMEAGDMAFIPGGDVHSARVLRAARVLDVFHPVREEYR